MIRFSDAAEADLRSISQKKHRRQVVGKVFEKLVGTARPRGSKLIERAGSRHRAIYRIRSGDYRILYSRDDVGFLILRIRHRKDAYRR